MTFRIRHLLRPRARSFAAAFCLLAASMQLVLPVLHGSHSDHFGPVHAVDPASGALRSAADPGGDPASTHEASTCLQCRLVSQFGSLSVATTSCGVPDLRASRVHDVPVEFSHTETAAGEAPPRAPPLSA